MNRLLAAAVLLSLLSVACGDKAPSSPTTPTAPTTPTTPTVTYSVTGTVSSAAGGAIAGATLRVLDGPNAGVTATTSGTGSYTLTPTSPGGFTMTASAAGYVSADKGVTVTQTAPAATASFTLLPSQLWTKTGSGDTVFDMPTYIKRVRITADYPGYSSNFIVRIGGSLTVNELVGSGWSQPHFEGTYLTSGGVVAITNSSGVSWSFTEVR